MLEDVVVADDRLNAAAPHATHVDYYPLTARGMPPPGQDFIDQALALGDPKPRVVGKGEEKRLESCGAVLDELYRDALYVQNFPMTVKVKGTTTPVQFIPGHLWTGAVTGPRRSRVMVVGKWPGPHEARAGRNLVGESGEILVEGLEEAGVPESEWGTWYITNLVKHPNPDPSSDKPSAAMIKNCMPLLENELRLVRPDYVLALGAEAWAALAGKEGGPVSRSQGRVILRQTRLDFGDGDPVFHAYRVLGCIHPAAVAHSADQLPHFRTCLKHFVETVTGKVAARPKEELHHEVIYNARRLHAVVDQIRQEEADPAIAIDNEWHGEYPIEPGAWLRTVQFSQKPGEAYCIALREEGGRSCFSGHIQEAVPALRKLLCEPYPSGKKPRIVGHNIRADLPWLSLGLDEPLGEAVKAACDAPPHLFRDDGSPEKPGWERTRDEGGFDTMLAAHSVRESDGSYALDVLGLQYAGVARYDQELEKWKAEYCRRMGIEAKNLGGYGMCPARVLHPYALWDADCTQRLFRALNEKWLEKDTFGNCSRVPFWISMRASLAFLEMEMTGLLIDLKRGDRLTDCYLKIREKLRQQLIDIFRWPDFNPQSHPQCRVALFGPEFSTKRDKKTGQFIDIRPRDDTLSLGLRPIKTSGKPSREWDMVVRRQQTHLFSPSTDKEVLGGLITRLAPKIKGGEAPFGYHHVLTLRNFRFAGQVVKSVLRAPVTDQAQKPLVDEEENYEYEEGLLSCVQADGRVRTHLFQTKETGRASSARPPLQNISKRREKAYKDILGKDYLYPLRTMIEATPGWALVEADYRGAELYMMAIQSGSRKMIEHCQRANLPDGHPDQYDIHSSIAVKAFGLTVPDLIDKDSGIPVAELLKCKVGDPLPPSKKALSLILMPHIRDVTKTIVFGIPYGRGDRAVVRAVEEEGTQISVDDAGRIREAVLVEYAELGPYFEACQARVTHPGWIRNCYGRYRRFQRMRFGDDGGGAQREAGNFPIQSGVADAVSRAADHLYNYPTRRDEQGQLKYRMVLQIHDAILFEVRIPYLDWFIGDEDHGVRGVVGDCMTRKVPVYMCDLDGRRVPGIETFHMGTEVAVYRRWGEKWTREEGLEAGVPEHYLPKPKKAA